MPKLCHLATAVLFAPEICWVFEAGSSPLRCTRAPAFSGAFSISSGSPQIGCGSFPSNSPMIGGCCATIVPLFSGCVLALGLRFV